MPKPTPFRSVTIQLPPELYERVARLADQEQRSISNMLRVITAGHLAEREDRSGKPKPPALES